MNVKSCVRKIRGVVEIEAVEDRNLDGFPGKKRPKLEAPLMEKS